MPRARRAAADLVLLLRERRAVVLLAVLVGLFLPLSLAVHQPGMQAWDLDVTRRIQAHRSPLLDQLAVMFSVWGGAGSLIVLTLASALILYATGRRLAAGICLAALTVFPINGVLKLLFGRLRPDAPAVQVILPALGLSYPSGHAMSSSAICGILAVMAWLHIPHPGARRAAASLLALAAVGIGLSRVYLGAHWLSDVLGGWTAGLLLVLGLTSLYRRYAPPER